MTKQLVAAFRRIPETLIMRNQLISFPHFADQLID